MKKSGILCEDIVIGMELQCDYYHPDDAEHALDDCLRDLDNPRC